MPTVSTATANRYALARFREPLDQLSNAQLRSAASALHISPAELRALRADFIDGAAAARSLRNATSTAVTDPTIGRRNVANSAVGARLASLTTPSSSSSSPSLAASAQESAPRVSRALACSWTHDQETPATQRSLIPAGSFQSETGAPTPALHVELAWSSFDRPKLVMSLQLEGVSTTPREVRLPLRDDGSFHVQSGPELFAGHVDNTGAVTFTSFGLNHRPSYSSAAGAFGGIALPPGATVQAQAPVPPGFSAADRALAPPVPGRASPAQIDEWMRTHPTPSFTPPPGGLPQSEQHAGAVDVQLGFIRGPAQLGGVPRLSVDIDGQGYLYDLRANGSFSNARDQIEFNERHPNLRLGTDTGGKRIEGFIDDAGIVHFTSFQLREPPPPPLRDWRVLGPPRTERPATYAHIADWKQHVGVSAFWHDQVSHALAAGDLRYADGSAAPPTTLYMNWSFGDVPNAFHLALNEEPLLWSEEVVVKPDGTFAHDGANFTAKGSVLADGRVRLEAFAYRGFDGREVRAHAPRNIDTRLPALSERWDGNKYAHATSPEVPAWRAKLERDGGSFTTSVKLSGVLGAAAPTIDVRIERTADGWRHCVIPTAGLGALATPPITFATAELRCSVEPSGHVHFWSPTAHNGDRFDVFGNITDDGWLVLNKLDATREVPGQPPVTVKLTHGAHNVGGKLTWRP